MDYAFAEPDGRFIDDYCLDYDLHYDEYIDNLDVHWEEITKEEYEENK